MGLLATLVTLPVSGPVKALGWVAQRVADAAGEELSEPDVHRELAELERARLFGELGEQEYQDREEALWQRLAAARRAEEDPDGE